MKTPILSVSQARNKLFRLVDETAETHIPVLITGKRNNAVLLAEEDWRSLQETLHLSSIPGMRKSILEGLNTPPSECDDDLEW